MIDVGEKVQKEWLRLLRELDATEGLGYHPTAADVADVAMYLGVKQVEKIGYAEFRRVFIRVRNEFKTGKGQ